MSKRTIKMFHSALKHAPQKGNIKLLQTAIKELSLPEAMARAQALLGEVSLQERRPAFFEGFAYQPFSSKAVYGEDEKLYGNRFVSTAFFYGAKKLYVYARTVCCDTDFVEESMADYRYQDIVGVELRKATIPHRGYTKKSVKIHDKDPQFPLQDEKSGILFPVLSFVLRTTAGERVYEINGDADAKCAVETFVKELRSVIEQSV